jgi:hypothetical protein
MRTELVGPACGYSSKDVVVRGCVAHAEPVCNKMGWIDDVPLLWQS